MPRSLPSGGCRWQSRFLCDRPDMRVEEEAMGSGSRWCSFSSLKRKNQREVRLSERFPVEYFLFRKEKVSKRKKAGLVSPQGMNGRYSGDLG